MTYIYLSPTLTVAIFRFQSQQSFVEFQVASQRARYGLWVASRNTPHSGFIGITLQSSPQKEALSEVSGSLLYVHFYR